MFVFKSTLIVLSTVLSVFIFYKSSLIFLSALIGVGVACLILPIINFLERKWKIPRFFATFCFLFIVAAIVLGLMFLAGSIMVDQVDSFKQSMPEIMARWQARFEKLRSDYPQVAAGIFDGQPTGIANGVLSYVQSLGQNFMAAITGLTLAAVMALFTAAHSASYYSGFVKLFPKKHQPDIDQKMRLAALTLRKWFFAQFIDMVVVGVLTTLGLWIIGVNYWALYGVFTGVLSIIPYVGILSVVVFSGAVVAVLQPEKLLWLMVVFIVTQQLEGNFILPKVMKDQLHIPAGLLIFLMILVGSWLGILGVFVTPPLLAIGVAIYFQQQSKNKTKDL